MAAPVEKPATDVYIFENLRRRGYTYVDKTGVLFSLVDGSIGNQFFIARPRRFGKSLCISTLQAIFEGKRELFKGLAIEKKWDWKQKWPVLRLDLGSCQAPTVEALWKKLDGVLKLEAQRNKVKMPDEETTPNKFLFLIKTLADKCRAKGEDGKRLYEMVLLIDEYDKPLLGHLCKDDVTEFRDALKEFYSVIKTTESCQRFAFITGISKFSKVSIFSDLNNLKDRTMTFDEATLFGYTHEEVKKYYPKMIAALGEKLGIGNTVAFERICAMYDGYRFHHEGECIINPVSLGLCLRNRDFGNYWSETAQPTFLIDILKKTPLDFRTVDLSEKQLNAYAPENPQIETLLFQTGYLTIKGSRMKGEDPTSDPPRVGTRVYELGFPNQEVENSFVSWLAPAYAGTGDRAGESALIAASDALLVDDTATFLKCLDVFFRSIPYDLTDRQNEQMWQAIVYVILKALGVYVAGEVRTADGRADMIIKMPDHIYILEFKLNDTAENAIKQIKKLKYHKPFELTKKGITFIGLGFSAKKRTITSKKVVVYRKMRKLPSTSK